MMSNDPVKLRAQLDADLCGTGGESFWAVAVPGHPDVYEVHNLLLFSPFGFGDWVRAIAPGPHDIPQVVEVVRRTSRVSVGVVFSASDSSAGGDTLDAQLGLLAGAYGEAAKAAGARVERMFPTSVALQLPGEVTLSLGDEAVVEWVAQRLETAERSVAKELPSGINSDSWEFGWDVLTGPDFASEGLITRLDAPTVLVGEGWRADDDDLFRSAVDDSALDRPDQMTNEMVFSKAEVSYQAVQRFRDAVDSRDPRRVHAAAQLTVRLLCAEAGLPLPPLDAPLPLDG